MPLTTPVHRRPWELVYEGYDPATEPLREALCTVGNGYVASRGAAPEAGAGGPHYPGTYVAGVFNRLTTEVAGRDVENESLVNVPDWLPLRVRVDGGPWLAVDDADVVDHRQVLDLHRGVLERRTRWRDAEGRETSVAQRRLAHMARPHLLALETTVRAENWSGRLAVRAELDGAVTNSGVARYRDLASRHLETLERTKAGPDTVLLRSRTTQSRVEIALAARTTVQVDGAPLDAERLVLVEGGERIGHQAEVAVGPGTTVVVDKVVAVFTSRDRAITEPGMAALTELADAPTFAALLGDHEAAWAALWARVAVDVEDGGPDDDQGRATQLVVDLHLFHLLETASPHIADLDVGIPARGLSGEAYRGHIFWDELFLFSLLCRRVPEVAAATLRYRHRRLGAARRAAAADGQVGAMFPWQSGSDGREENQVVHLNPASGHWLPDESHRQRHIGLTIAHNVWRYWEVTDDVEFLAECGAELFLEVARYFAGLATFDEAKGRYTICGVMGPDEFHDADPGWDQPGLRNNAYTNVMVSWLLARAADVLRLLPVLQRDALVASLGLTPDVLARWEDVSRRLHVPFHLDEVTGGEVISQFEGYEALAELDWEGMRARYGDIARLDRLLEAEGRSVNDVKASKQADVLMLFYVLSRSELDETMERLGYEFDDAALERTIGYYLVRTSHGSTLSRVVHSWVLARLDRPRSVELFREALDSDIADVQGGTTQEGVHLGAMAGTVDLLERGYSGLEVRDGVLRFVPDLPAGIGRVAFRIYHRGRWVHVDLTPEQLTLTSEETRLAPLRVAAVTAGVQHEAELASGARLTFDVAAN